MLAIRREHHAGVPRKRVDRKHQVCPADLGQVAMQHQNREGMPAARKRGCLPARGIEALEALAQREESEAPREPEHFSRAADHHGAPRPGNRARRRRYVAQARAAEGAPLAGAEQGREARLAAIERPARDHDEKAAAREHRPS